MRAETNRRAYLKRIGMTEEEFYLHTLEKQKKAQDKIDDAKFKKRIKQIALTYRHDMKWFNKELDNKLTKMTTVKKDREVDFEKYKIKKTECKKAAIAKKNGMTLAEFEGNIALYGESWAENLQFPWIQDKDRWYLQYLHKRIVVGIDTKKDKHRFNMLLRKFNLKFDEDTR